MKINEKNHDEKRIAIASISIGIISVNLILALAMNNCDGTLSEVNRILPMIAYYFLICSVLFVVCSFIVFWLIRFLSKDILKTSIHLMVKKITVKQLSKNANIVTPCLQMFLYEILKKNKEITLLSVGQNMSCLLPDGYYIRNNCVFYRYCLTTSKPEYDNRQLKRIVQGLINSELNNYGIVNLNSVYSGKIARCYSVYIDSIFYDDINNSLVLDVLYICSENSAQYFIKAVNNNDKPVDNKVVYDDEI